MNTVVKYSFYIGHSVLVLVLHHVTTNTFLQTIYYVFTENVGSIVPRCKEPAPVGLILMNLRKVLRDYSLPGWLGLGDCWQGIPVFRAPSQAYAEILDRILLYTHRGKFLNRVH